MSCKIIIDKLSGHDQEGKIGKMNVKIGDEVKEGDLLFTIESGKGTVKCLAKTDGVITDLSIEEGDTVKKSQIVGNIEGEDKPKKQSYVFGISAPVKEEINCDVLVIGGGPGGYVAAIRAAQLGQKTVLIEQDKLGGTCLNYGCIPTKALVQSINVLENIKEGYEFGFQVDDYKIDFKRVIERKDKVVKQLVTGIQGLMEKNNIRVIEGRAVAQDSKTIQVQTKKIDASIKFGKLILAVGAKPTIPPIEGIKECEILTSKEMLELDKIPKSLTIIGGGIIGMEFAFIYNALGTEVNIVEFLPRILACVDPDVSEVVQQAAISKGINIYEEARAISIRKTMNQHIVTELEMNGKRHLLSSEKVLMAVGRKANIEAINLEVLGVDLNEKQNGIKVNEYMQTSNENIYAIGDITNKIQLAHVASHQGMVAAEHIAGHFNEMQYDLIPSAIFTYPEIGTVGLSETEAIKMGKDIKVVRFPFIASGKAIAMNELEGFVKLIVDSKENVILGGAIVGGHGTELIAVLTYLIQEKIQLKDAINAVYAHPTLSEAIHEALLMADDRGIHFD